MTSKILEAFNLCKKEKRPALLTYTVAGDDTKKRSLEIIKSIAQYADIIELGFPHNTPVADGGQIQESSHRALQHGIKLRDIFSIIKDFKKSITAKPLILMGYFNLILQYGTLKFLKESKIFFLIDKISSLILGSSLKTNTIIDNLNLLPLNLILII